MLGTCTEKLLWVTGKRKFNLLIEELCWAVRASFTALFRHKPTDVEVSPIHPPSHTWGRKKGLARTSVLLLLLPVRDDGLLQQQGEMLSCF